MVPHATQDEGPRRRSTTSSAPRSFKFPDYKDADVFPADGEDIISREPSPRPLPNGLPPGLHSSERWPPRRASALKSWVSGTAHALAPSTRPSRQKSLSEAIRTVRTRKASFNENAQEIAESLKAPVSLKLVVCTKSWERVMVRLMSFPALMHFLVRNVHSHKHLLEGHLDRTAQTGHPHCHPVYVGLFLVCFPLVAC